MNRFFNFALLYEIYYYINDSTLHTSVFLLSYFQADQIVLVTYGKENLGIKF